jgi:dihydropyrimidinase
VNEDGMVENDVYVEDGIIKKIGRKLIINGGKRVIDDRGKYVIKGGIEKKKKMKLEFMGEVYDDEL